MKTFEFKLNLKQNQIEDVERWLDILKVVWNRGLAILEWKQHHDRFQKCLKPEIYYEKIPFYQLLYFFRLLVILQFDGFVKYLLPSIAVPPHSIDLTETWGFDFKPVSIKATKAKKGWAYYCTIAAEFRKDKSKGWEVKDNLELRPIVNLVKAHWQTEPITESYSAVSLRKPFAQKRWDWIKGQNIPMLFINDYLGITLAESWKLYSKGKGEKPKYKRRRDKVKTIPSDSFRAQCKREGDLVKIPSLGWLKLKDLTERIPEGADISTFKICRRASGFYLKLGVHIEKVRKCRGRSTSILLEPGSYQTDGLTKDIPQYLQKSLAKLEKLQQKLSTQTVGSNRWKKQVNRIARLHEKIKRQRKGWQDWHSSAIADIYNTVHIIEADQKVKKPDPRIDKEQKKYLPNGAEIKADRNRATLDSGVASFREQIIARVEERNGTVELEKQTVESPAPKKAKENKAQIENDAKIAKVRPSRRKRNKRRKTKQEQLEPAI